MAIGTSWALHVFDGPAERVSDSALLDRFLAQAEIGQFHVAVGVE